MRKFLPLLTLIVFSVLIACEPSTKNEGEINKAEFPEELQGTWVPTIIIELKGTTDPSAFTDNQKIIISKHQISSGGEASYDLVSCVGNVIKLRSVMFPNSGLRGFSYTIENNTLIANPVSGLDDTGLETMDLVKIE